MQKLAEFLTNSQGHIVEMWLNGLDLDTNQYNINEIRKNGEVVLQLFIDIHIPFDKHHLYDVIPRISEYHVVRDTPIDIVMHSLHIWRKCLVKLIHEYLVQEQLNVEEAMLFFESLHERIDQMQRVICNYYWKYAKQRAKSHEEKIQQLHEDRLNLLGKMAASMAHEIRNPLFAIQGFIKLIRKSLPQEAAQQVGPYMDVIEKECEGLYGQITTFLSFSKNNGKDELPEECSMNEIIASVISLVYPRVIADDIEMDVVTEQDVKLVVQKVGIQQVLSNLINNSIDALCTVEYAKKITIIHGLDTNGYYISVVDNGPGIPEEIKGSIFEPFVTTKKTGTGLGLSICKQIMRKNHGDLICSSCEKETKFTMSFMKDRVVSS